MIVAPPVYPFAAPSAAPTAVEAVRASEPEPVSALAAALSLEPLPAAQGGRRAWEPSYVLQLGMSMIDGQYDTGLPQSFEASPLLSLDFVAYNWRSELGVGLEGGLWMNSYDVTQSGGIGSETVDTWRVSAGLRFADRGTDDPIWIPYVRFGGLYRSDEGSQTSDSDFGWYAGLGVDFRLGSRFALTPQVLYSESPSLNSQEWLLGVALTIGF